MWKPPASASALLLLALALPAAAQDLGEPVLFGPSALSSLSFLSDPSAGSAPILSLEGHAVAVPWDTILFQGDCPDPAVTFELSRRDAAGSWTPWVPAFVKRFPQGRFWAKARLGPAAPGALRLRALSAGSVASHLIEIYGFEVFASRETEPKARSRRKGKPAARGLEAARPPVHGRDEWGAAPAKEPYTPVAFYRLTLHHTSGPQTNALDASLKEVRFIQDFHQHGRGWNDIAYHFLIDAAGNIFEGRPESALGAHTRHNNEGNLGVVLLGSYHPPQNHALTAAQRAALVSLGRYAVSRHAIDPATLRGHRDYKATDCPGDLVYPLLPEFRREFAPPPPPTVTLLAPAWD